MGVARIYQRKSIKEHLIISKLFFFTNDSLKCSCTRGLHNFNINGITEAKVKEDDFQKQCPLKCCCYIEMLLCV
jgi:hypothetical protein